jgi:hypothetical protein
MRIFINRLLTVKKNHQIFIYLLEYTMFLFRKDKEQILTGRRPPSKILTGRRPPSKILTGRRPPSKINKIIYCMVELSILT